MTGPASHRRPGARPSLSVALALSAGLLAACGTSGDVDSATQAAAAPTEVRRPTLVDPRPLPGAGAVAFDPVEARLAWAAGEEVRLHRLAAVPDAAAGAGDRRLPVGSRVSDLGFAPDGALWVVAGVPQLWRGGAPVCRATGVEADRLLAVDGEGAVVAAYRHSDGVGMLRRQVWLDARCAVAGERLDPLPPDMAGADEDPGAPLGRSSLRPPRQDAAALARQLSRLRLPAGAGVEQAVRVSPDGGWWVLEGAQGRTLWRRAQP